MRCNHALQSLDTEEAWFQANKEAVHNKIGRGLAELDRGDGLSGKAACIRPLMRHPPVASALDLA